MSTAERTPGAVAVPCALAWSAAVAAAARLGVWPAIGGAAVVLGALVLALDAPSRSRLRPSPAGVTAGVAAGAAMGVLTLLLYPLATRAHAPAADQAAQLYAGFGALSPGMAALALVPVVVGEDLVWRGVVQSALMRRLGIASGVLAAAGLYALAQLPLGSPLLVLVAFGCGLAWSALRAATGSLVPVIVAHLLWDFVVLLWHPLAG